MMNIFSPSRQRPGHVRMSGRPCRRKQQEKRKKKGRKRRREEREREGREWGREKGANWFEKKDNNLELLRLSIKPPPNPNHLYKDRPKGGGRKTPRPLHVAKRVPRFYMCKRCSKNVQAETVKEINRGARFESAHVQPFAVPVSH